MTGESFGQLVHLGGTLAADAAGVIRIPLQGATLVEVVATGANANGARLNLGTVADPDGYLVAARIGQSGVPAVFTAREFDGVLADSLRWSPPHLAKHAVMAWALDFDGADVDAVQTVTIDGAPTGGTFTLTFAGETAVDLAHNISAANLQVALRALTSIDGANVTVAGDTGGPYTVTFMGTLAAQSVATLLTDGAGLTGGDSPRVIVTVTTAGATAVAAADVDLQFTFLEG